ncbi:MAG: hypothetical protein MUP63_04510 [Candidatus Nanohaloarchaeota archaeon QJJ-7]|nr:hypothetical protein [Candidatus Nanohaloarchaeota archaeon QJJ-7]
MDVDRNHVIGAFAVIVILGIVGGLIYVQDSGSSTSEAVREMYELSTGTEMEVLDVEDRGSIDKFILKPVDGDQVTEAYVTEDGRYIVSDPVSIENYTRQAKARNNFVSCLSDEGARFYGILSSNQTFAQHSRMTQLQMQVLGGNQGIQDVFGGPGQGQIRNAVLQSGVVWNVDGNFTSGLRTVPQLEEMTGCNYTVQD